MTPRTRALARASIRTRSLGLRQIKGLEAPVEVHELVGASSVRSRPHATTGFVGRQAELDLLFRALDQARAGRGQVVALVGEPGWGSPGSSAS